MKTNKKLILNKEKIAEFDNLSHIKGGSDRPCSNTCYCTIAEDCWTERCEVGWPGTGDYASTPIVCNPVTTLPTQRCNETITCPIKA